MTLYSVALTRKLFNLHLRVEDPGGETLVNLARNPSSYSSKPDFSLLVSQAIGPQHDRSHEYIWKSMQRVLKVIAAPALCTSLARCAEHAVHIKINKL